MVKRWCVIVVVAMAGLICSRGMAQGQPGQLGGFSPEDMQAIQQMQDMTAQMMQRMQQQGIDPLEFGQQMFQQMQDGSFDPAEFQQQLIDKGILDQQMMTRMQGTTQNLALNMIRRQLGSTDEEWNIVKEKLQKVVAALADVDQLGQGGMGAGMMMGGPPASEAAKALKDLKTALKDKRTTDLEVGIKLRTWRDLHEKAKKALVEAREGLRGILTLRQEAILLGMGILD